MDTYAGRVQIRWAPDEEVTPLGQLPFLIDFLKQGGLFDAFVEGAPLSYSSNNRPRVRDVLGTLLLAILSGARRYMHVNVLRHDAVNPRLLGMQRVCSDDSVRRAIARMDEKEATGWLRKHLERSLRPLWQQPWVLDIDTSVKPVYGHQEGAQVGYNPHKPGRASLVVHSYLMGELRLVLDTEVEPGKQVHSMYSLPGLERLLDGMQPQERPALVRGDRHYGTERVMVALEERGQDYLFRLILRPRVKALVARLASEGGWQKVGRGWEATESKLQLQGWTRVRRVVLLRRQVRERKQAEPKQHGQLPLPFTEVVEAGPKYEYGVLVTSLQDERLTVAQLYRDRADVENAFDELKNQWGWGGFMTQDLKRTRIMVRMNALFYNWWSVYARMIDPDTRREAKTSRPMMMDGVARVTRHGRQTTLVLTIAHSAAARLRESFEEMARFLRELPTAPQLAEAERWCRILERAYKKYYGDRGLRLTARPLLA
ncbi:MAG: transposase [Candidatus Tectomicrobia bacterium]|nr:transposase [Candidatus Tectomicrobia bacterium]